MKIFSKFNLPILVATALFLPFFSGLYLYGRIYLSSYFAQNPYEWYVFGSKEEFPSGKEILLSGFIDPFNVLVCLLLAYLSGSINQVLTDRFSITNKLLHSFVGAAILTFLVTVLYFIYLFLRSILVNHYTVNYALGEMTPQLGWFAFLYLLIVTTLATVLNYRNMARNR